jgi:hypothetical protein
VFACRQALGAWSGYLYVLVQRLDQQQRIALVNADESRTYNATGHTEQLMLQIKVRTGPVCRMGRKQSTNCAIDGLLLRVTTDCTCVMVHKVLAMPRVLLSHALVAAQGLHHFLCAAQPQANACP